MGRESHRCRARRLLLFLLDSCCCRLALLLLLLLLLLEEEQVDMRLRCSCPLLGLLQLRLPLLLLSLCNWDREIAIVGG